jgi:sigma-E factor negative regulatory protein RseC
MIRPIKHDGIVQENTGSKVKVLIEQRTSCSTCEAQAACSISHKPKKVVEVDALQSDYQPGEKVRVLLESHLAIHALLFTYIYPFVCVLLTLILVYYTTHSEMIAGLASLGILIPYFLLLKIYNQTLKKKYIFRIERMTPLQ